MTSTSFDTVCGRRILITGEVGSGKTTLMRKLLNEALEGGKEEITLIDMAPERISTENGSIGGRLLGNPVKRVRLLTPSGIKAPRLTAKSPDELVLIADSNRAKIEKVLEMFNKAPTKVLFINDASMYLQRGDLETLLAAISKAETVVVNAYLGERLKNDLGTGLSKLERELVLSLGEKMDDVIQL